MTVAVGAFPQGNPNQGYGGNFEGNFNNGGDNGIHGGAKVEQCHRARVKRRFIHVCVTIGNAS